MMGNMDMKQFEETKSEESKNAGNASKVEEAQTDNPFLQGYK